MDRRRIRILVVDDDVSFLRQMGRLLGSKYVTECASNGEEALAALRAGGIDAALLDLDFGHGTDGLQILEDLHRLDPDLPVIMVTKDESARSAIAALERGAAGYFNKVSDLDLLARQLQEALEKQQLRERYHFLRRETDAAQGEMVGATPVMQRLRTQLGTLAMRRAPVLITGETGTGKEVVARLLHRLCCPEGPFVPINCAAVSSELIESELFGCVPGAFTGALLRRGAFEVAAQGILFLDEITEVSPSFQVKLNRVIEYDEFAPVGGDPVRSKKQFLGRVVAATIHDPATAMAEGKLRSDLFHRFPHVVTVPPLRERLEDIPLLTDRFLDRATRMRGARRPAIELDDVRRLLAYSWPGNVRELRNVIENFVLSDVLPTLGAALAGPHATELADLGTLPYAEAKRIAVRRFQEAYVRPILMACHGDLRAAAERMELTLPGLKKVLAELEGSAEGEETLVRPSHQPEAPTSPPC